jgi:hypothetical protein
MLLICIVRGSKGTMKKEKETIVTVIHSFRKYAVWYKNRIRPHRHHFIHEKKKKKKERERIVSLSLSAGTSTPRSAVCAAGRWVGEVVC